MKPDWKDAPEWAKYLAMDGNGDWYWYERRPSSAHYAWSNGPGRMQYASTAYTWAQSLESRPE